MKTGWLDAAMESAFGDEPACDFCGDDLQVRMVAVGGDVMDVEIPCPFCVRGWPLLVVPVRWFLDSPVEVLG